MICEILFLLFQDISESLDYLLDKNDINGLKYWGNSLEKEALQLSHLLDNLLNWALAQRNELEVNFNPFDLSLVANEIVSSTRHISKMKEVTLQNEIPANFKVTSDRRILEMVFRNLVSNAFRYTKKGESIKISARKIDTSIQIEIRDNGTGMNQQKVEQLFQIKKGLNDQKGEEDLSIGLHLCQELLALINGSLHVKSKEGEGTSFFLHLVNVVEDSY